MPSIWFTYENDGSGEPNENHTDALLHWSGFVTSDWNNGVNGTFTLTLSNGYDSDIVYSMNLSLRSLVGDGYTVIDGQTQGEQGVSASGASGFCITADQFDWGVSSTPTSFSLTFDAEGRITNYDFTGAAWTEDGTFRIKLQDGTRPSSYVAGRGVSLRHIIPDPLVIPYSRGAGSTALQVEADTGPWNWSGYTDGLAVSALTAPDSPYSATLTVSWGAGSLQDGESGSGSLTIERSDGSTPWSTVAIPTTVEAASCCEPPTMGNVDCEGIVDIGDVTEMIALLFIRVGDPFCCEDEADLDYNGDIDIGDLTILINRLFITVTDPPPCP